MNKLRKIRSSQVNTLLCPYVFIYVLIACWGYAVQMGENITRGFSVHRERERRGRETDRQTTRLTRRTDRDCMLSFRPFMFFRDIFGTILYQHKNPWFSIFTMASETQLLRRLYCMSIAFINLGNHQFIMFHHWVSISVLHIWYAGAESTFIGFSQQKNL